MAHFALRLNSPRKTFPADMTDAERAIMQQHVVYWTGHSATGTVIAFGPVLDPAGAWGLAVVEAANSDAASALTRDDPVITANLGFSYDILPMPSLVLRPNA
jgi:uncharacterized protein YciI